MGPMLTLAEVPHIYSVPSYFFEFSTKYIFSWTKSGGATIGFSTLAFLMLAIAALTWLLLRFTMLGKGIYAHRRQPGGRQEGRLQHQEDPVLHLLLRRPAFRHRLDPVRLPGAPRAPLQPHGPAAGRDRRGGPGRGQPGGRLGHGAGHPAGSLDDLRHPQQPGADAHPLLLGPGGDRADHRGQHGHQRLPPASCARRTPGVINA